MVQEAKSEIEYISDADLKLHREIMAEINNHLAQAGALRGFWERHLAAAYGDGIIDENGVIHRRPQAGEAGLGA